MAQQVPARMTRNHVVVASILLGLVVFDLLIADALGVVAIPGWLPMSVAVVNLHTLVAAALWPRGRA
jgi:hypothetical protein